MLDQAPERIVGSVDCGFVRSYGNLVRGVWPFFIAYLERAQYSPWLPLRSRRDLLGRARLAAILHGMECSRFSHPEATARVDRLVRVVLRWQPGQEANFNDLAHMLWAAEETRMEMNSAGYFGSGL